MFKSSIRASSITGSKAHARECSYSCAICRRELGRPVRCDRSSTSTERLFPFWYRCLETAGSSLENVLKCNVYCTSVEKFAAFNTIYARYFPKDPPARVFVCIPAWPGPFDIEVDCIAVRKGPSE